MDQRRGQRVGPRLAGCAVLIVVPLGLLFLVINAWVRPHETPTEPEPPVGVQTPSLSPGMFDFSDATRLGFDFTRSPAVGHVPACFGPVERLALVSPDLASTLWEVQATGPGIELHESFVVGSTPPGFRSVTPLGEPLPASAFLVANGPDGLGLGLLQPQNREQPAGDCT